MSLPRFSIERPVTLMMIVVGILVFGVISLELLPQELFPQIVYPQLTVVTPYANAAPEEIETLITRPVEEAVGTVSGIKRIHSISREGISLVIAEFGWSQNINFASLGMREKIDLIKERLPREADEPVVLQYNPFDRPIIILSVTSTNPDRTAVALREITRKMIKDEIEKVEGVASASLSGGLEREIQVEVDQDKLIAHDIPILDVSKNIGSANLNYPAGTIKESFYEYLIRTLGEFEHVRDIEDVSVGAESQYDGMPYAEDAGRSRPAARAVARDRRLVYVKDVSSVIDGVKERTSYSRFNGKENISVSIQKQALGNTVKIIERVKNKIKELRLDLPKDVDITIVYDQSDFIRESIRGVWDAAWQGGVLVFFILLYFLRNFWTALIVTVTIPVSVLATFALMFFFGISINMMSLGGLAFGVGSLVDASIVVIENIFRHMQLGKNPKEAAVIGADEVAIAVAGSVLTTVVVFLPLIFVIGIIGQISKDFALTVTFSLLTSWVASITLIPLLTSRLNPAAVKTAVPGGEELGEVIEERASIAKVKKFYSVLTLKFLNQRRKYLTYTLILFFVSAGIFLILDKELMPKVDQGQFVIKLDMPAGTRIDITNRISERLEHFILSIPEVESVNVTVGSTQDSATKSVLERLGQNQAEISVNLKKVRKLKSADVVQIIKNQTEALELEGSKVEYILQENVLNTGMQAQAAVTIEVKGNNLSELEALAKTAQGKLKNIKGVYGTKNDLAEPSPESKVLIDKDKASMYGLSVTDIAQTALIGLKGYVATKFKEKGQEYDVLVRLRKRDRDDFDKLGRLAIRSPLGVNTRLSSVASFGKGKGPSEIRRLNQERVVFISANVYNRSLKDVYSDVNALIKSIDIPKGYFMKLAGETEEMKASFRSMQSAIIAAFALVYMVMAALFESLWQPFIIMFTIPLSLIGVSWGLLITRTSISAYVLMGIGILGGIVVDNAIVLVDCINLFRGKGMELKEAVIKASKVRIRPILMTALSTILGLLPMAVLRGEGSELRSPMAITVMAGLLIATFLTIIVIPTIYLMSEESIAKLFRRKNAARAG